MYIVSPELYRETAARLCDALDGEAYYSGSLEFPFDGMECRLVASVIVYRRREVAPEGRTEPISDLVPVWWEFHTVGDEGECLNDFSFAEMTRYLL